MSRLLLRLYVAGDGPNSVAARSNLRRLLSPLDPAQYQVEIIDCMEDPVQALREGVYVTPTMLRCEPQPVVTIIGSLSDVSAVRDALGLPDPDRQERGAGNGQGTKAASPT